MKEHMKKNLLWLIVAIIGFTAIILSWVFIPRYAKAEATLIKLNDSDETFLIPPTLRSTVNLLAVADFFWLIGLVLSVTMIALTTTSLIVINNQNKKVINWNKIFIILVSVMVASLVMDIILYLSAYGNLANDYNGNFDPVTQTRTSAKIVIDFNLLLPKLALTIMPTFLMIVPLKFGKITNQNVALDEQQNQFVTNQQ